MPKKINKNNNNWFYYSLCIYFPHIHAARRYPACAPPLTIIKCMLKSNIGKHTQPMPCRKIKDFITCSAFYWKSIVRFLFYVVFCCARNESWSYDIRTLFNIHKQNKLLKATLYLGIKGRKVQNQTGNYKVLFYEQTLRYRTRERVVKVMKKPEKSSTLLLSCGFTITSSV